MEDQNRDFKYFMQDTGSLYLGAKYSYREILEDEMVTFKYKSIVEHYILYYMTPEQFSYKTYKQLKARVKVSVLEKKKRLFGGPKVAYVNKILKLEELVGMNLAQKKKSGIVVQELVLSKLALMSFSV